MGEIEGSNLKVILGEIVGGEIELVYVCVGRQRNSLAVWVSLSVIPPCDKCNRKVLQMTMAPGHLPYKMRGFQDFTENP